MGARRIAVSYSRLSDLKQAKGDGEDRQDRDFRAFCSTHNLTPLLEVYIDRGRSGYHDEHRKKGRLGQLIAAAKDGLFEPGTVIVVEAWDRLGRLRPDRQTDLVAQLLRTGVNIGVCRLNDVFTEEDFGTHKWAILSTFIMLAHQESKQKADRVAASWMKRRERAREHGSIMSARLPAWLRLEGKKGDGAVVPIPARVATIRRIFELSAAGHGKARIVGRLIKDNVPTFGTSGKWTTPYVAKILNDRRVLGEVQPRRNDGAPDGAVIPDYFPRVVTDEEYALARAAQGARRGPGGTRDRKHVNVFQSLLRSAIDGGGFVLHNHGTGQTPRLVLVNAEGMAGRGPTQTFPYDVFEDGALSLLAEVRAEDVLPPPTDERRRADELRAKLARLRGDLEALRADLKRGYDRHLADLLRECGAEEESTAALLHEELARSARPAERAWGELPSLVALVRHQGDEARLKVRALLRAIVSEARLLLLRRHSRILAAVQFFFVGGAVRNYLFVYQIAGRNRPRGWSVQSLAAIAPPGSLDLRDPAHAQRLAAALEKVDLAALRLDG